jgi:N-acetylglucosamine-6-phosphate deacetylase
MTKILLKNAKLPGNNPPGSLKNIFIEDGDIVQISGVNKRASKSIDLKGRELLPGFIDFHNHGAVGIDVNSTDQKGLIKIGKFLVKQGVTGWLPTLVPDSNENYQKVINAINELMKIQDDLPIARVLGVHYEGVFANKKMCGALRPEYFKSFEPEKEFNELPKLTRGIHLTTLAPEIENGIELIKELVKRNWIISIGHSNADYDILEEALANGARHLTHFFNAMTGLHHRNLGVAGWALTNNEVTFDIIADGIHIHPKMLKFAISTKTAEKVSLISDSISPTGSGDGDFEIWGEKISVRNGKTQNEKGSIAGSVITMLDAFQQMLSLGFSEITVSKMASLNPAKLLGIDKDYGSIDVGKRADLVVIDENGEVKLVLVKGMRTDNR